MRQPELLVLKPAPMRGLPTPKRLRLALALLPALAAEPLAAAICGVPSVAYPTILAALADPSCDPIQLAGSSFTESFTVARDVTITGAGSGSTRISGWAIVNGATTEAELGALRIDSLGADPPLCSGAGLDVRNGAEASGVDLVVVGGETPGGACLLFADAFELGDLSAWSSGGV